jgi:hypothetical protein
MTVSTEWETKTAGGLRLGRSRRNGPLINGKNGKMDKLDKKLDSNNRAVYLKAGTYLVEYKVTYTRIRKVRATSEKEAIKFAMNREHEALLNFFRGTRAKNFDIKEATPLGVKEMFDKEKSGEWKVLEE